MWAKAMIVKIVVSFSLAAMLSTNAFSSQSKEKIKTVKATVQKQTVTKEFKTARVTITKRGMTFSRRQ